MSYDYHESIKKGMKEYRWSYKGLLQGHYFMAMSDKEALKLAPEGTDVVRWGNGFARIIRGNLPLSTGKTIYRRRY